MSMARDTRDLQPECMTKAGHLIYVRQQVSWRKRHTRYVTLKSTAEYELWLLNSVSAAVRFVA